MPWCKRVTALKQREAEVAEKSALLQATLDNMHQGVLVNDAATRVVMWNDRFLEMNGLRPDDVHAGMRRPTWFASRRTRRIRRRRRDGAHPRASQPDCAAPPKTVSASVPTAA